MPETALVVPGVSDEDVAGTLMNVKTYPQYLEMVENILAGKCVFCDPLAPINVIVAQNDLWRGWENPYPLKPEDHVQRHFIIATRRHITHIMELTPADGAALFELFPAFRVNTIVGGGLLMRFGHPERNAGSVRHIHLNGVCPDGEGEVRLPLGKKAEDRAEKRRIVAVFEKMRQGTAFKDLFPDEQGMVANRLTAK